MVWLACLAANACLAVEAVPYSELTDEQLQALVERWETLGVDERRAVATEINRRTSEERRVVRIEGERRYGYRVRRPDGSVVTVERRQKIIRYVNPDQPYGVGFEERRGAEAEPPAPAQRVKHQSRPSP